MAKTREQQVIQFFLDYQTETKGVKAASEGVNLASRSNRARAVRTELDRFTQMTADRLTDDYVMIDPYGDVVDRQHVLDRVQNGDNLFADYERLDHQVFFVGTTAIYISLVKIGGQRMGRDISGQYREMHVLQKRKGVWIVVATQMTKVDPTHHPNR